MSARLTIPLVLVLASCTRSDEPAPSPTEPPAPSAPASEVAAELAEGSAEAAEAAEAAEVPDAVVAPDPWGRCARGEEALVTSWPLLLDGEVVTVGARLSSGALASAYPFLSPEAPFAGTWVCANGPSGTEVWLRASVAGVRIGPRWGLDALEPGPDGRPPEPAPLNRSAQAVMGAWSGSAEDAAATLAGAARCRARNDVFLSSGAFIFLEALGEALDAASVGWLALPADDVSDRDAAWDAVLRWEESGEPAHARWRVAPEVPACMPLDENAARIGGLTEGVPSVVPMDLGPANVRADDTPYREHDGARRSLLYVAAEQRELRTVSDWVAFRDRGAPFQGHVWTTAPAEEPDRFANTLDVVTGETTYTFGWDVDPGSGDARPNGRLAELVRAAQPRRLPGVEAPEERPAGLTPAEIDDVVGASGPELTRCLRAAGVGTVTLRWRVQWDGHPFDVRAELEEEAEAAALSRCVADVAEAWRFPIFAGDAFPAATTLTLP